MAEFKHYAPLLKELEGGYAYRREDKGGPTNMGVTLNTYRLYFGKAKTAEDLLNITDGEWSFIMRKYWDGVKADEIRNQSIAEIVADWNVNSGRKGIKAMQKALGLDPDGIIGPKSLAVLNSPNEAVIFHRIKVARESYYIGICYNDPTQKIFLNGWKNRLRRFAYSSE